MKIHFVRHGQTEYNKNFLITGHTDEPLNEEGIKQAKDTIPLLSQYSEIYCSDLIRCKQTADILNKNLNLKISYDGRLRERNLGSLEGKKWDDFDLIDPSLREKDRNQEYDYNPFGGESVGQVTTRLLSAITDIKNNHNTRDTILVVTHGGIIRLLYKILKGEIVTNIKNSSINEFNF